MVRSCKFKNTPTFHPCIHVYAYDNTFFTVYLQLKIDPIFLKSLFGSNCQINSIHIYCTIAMVTAVFLYFCDYDINVNFYVYECKNIPQSWKI